MENAAISITAAARSMLSRGFTGPQVEKILNSLKQPTPGYVLATDIPMRPPQ
jgi:hypothetical protein